MTGGRARSAAGAFQVPAVGVRHLIEQGLLVEVLPELRCESMPVALVYAHRRNLPRRLRVFLDWIAQVMEPHVEREMRPSARV